MSGTLIGSEETMMKIWSLLSRSQPLKSLGKEWVNTSHLGNSEIKHKHTEGQSALEIGVSSNSRKQHKITNTKLDTKL